VGFETFDSIDIRDNCFRVGSWLENQFDES
jgi:hypothetical protein